MKYVSIIMTPMEMENLIEKMTKIKTVIFIFFDSIK